MAPRIIRTTSHSVIAPETSLMTVKLAASMLVCLRAIRQSSELPVNAIIASDVRQLRVRRSRLQDQFAVYRIR